MAARSWLVLVLLASCAAPRPRVYADHPLFTSSGAACVQSPVLCATVAGAPESGSAVQAIGVGVTIGAVVVAEALDTVIEKKVEDVLKECADLARSDVLIRRFGGRSPTPEECREKVTVPGREDVTRAMLLGQEMHRVAFKCVEEKLGKVLPGRFSLEQRYRYDQATKTATALRPEDVEALKRAGRWSELIGTIVPDVVIHKGDPRYVQAVYDFKFRCVNTDAMPEWTDYEDGPYRGKSQGKVYQEALGPVPHLVAPRLGVF